MALCCRGAGSGLVVGTWGNAFSGMKTRRHPQGFLFLRLKLVEFTKCFGSSELT